MTDVDAQEMLREVASLARSHVALNTWLRALDGRDPAARSRLPGWSLGHVLTHLARNADSVLDMLVGRPQYAGGRKGRIADIEAGAVRPWDELLGDVIDSAAAVDAAFAERDDWAGTVQTVGPVRPLAMLPLLRQREVEVHRVDLGLGYEFDDLPSDYVRRDLRVMEMAWRAAQPIGVGSLPAGALGASPARRLGWLFGRIELDGVPPARVY